MRLTHRFRFKAHRGSVLPLFVLLVITLITALGLAIYIGLNMIVQHELQKVVSTASLVGAASFYDDIDGNGKPVKSPGKAVQAAQAAYDHALTASGMLKNMNTSLMQAPTAGDGTVSMTAKAVIPTAFLAPIGINQLELSAGGMGEAVSVTLPPVSVSTASGPLSKIVPLSTPLIDGPGVDLHVVAGQPVHGYRIEACSGGTCYDITAAAKLDGPGLTVDAPLGVGGPIGRVIYGSAYMDLAAVSPTYSGYVKKASALRIVDDGVFDQYDLASGTRSIELIPQPTTLSSIEIYHYGSLCSNGGDCRAPAPYVRRP